MKEEKGDQAGNLHYDSCPVRRKMMLALDTRVMRRTWTALDQELIGRVIYATQLPCLCEAIYHGTGFRELRRPPSFAILGNDDQVLLHDR